MRVLVNALSLGSISGQHVLFGHLKQLATWTSGQHEFILLHQPKDSNVTEELRGHSNIVPASATALSHHWLTRSVWETAQLPRMMKSSGIDLYFTPSGTILPRSPVPQISLAQNPWCFVRELQTSAATRFKARLQRTAYKKAAVSADLMVYNSDHIRQLYLRNAGSSPPTQSIIAYQGINEETHDAGLRLKEFVERQDFHIVSVSAMARWKAAETIIRAVSALRQRGIPATLSLVGPWPDTLYEQEIRRLIDELKLTDVVRIHGKVTIAELHRHYASARVYCLMSRCESFGIPAVEAQAFGTPVVGTTTTAMHEIGGMGGMFCEPDQPEQTASLLEILLTDTRQWTQYSQAALLNVQRFRWEHCSRPLMRMFDINGG